MTIKLRPCYSWSGFFFIEVGTVAALDELYFDDQKASAHASLALPAAIIAVFLIIITPFVISWVASSQIRDMRLGELTIVNADFNPFTLKLAVEGYELAHEEVVYLRSDRLAVDLTWAPLFRCHIDVEEIALAGADFRLRQSADGARVALPPLPPGTAISLPQDRTL